MFDAPCRCSEWSKTTRNFIHRGGFRNWWRSRWRWQFPPCQDSLISWSFSSMQVSAPVYLWVSFPVNRKKATTTVGPEIHAVVYISIFFITIIMTLLFNDSAHAFASSLCWVLGTHRPFQISFRLPEPVHDYCQDSVWVLSWEITQSLRRRSSFSFSLSLEGR